MSIANTNYSSHCWPHDKEQAALHESIQDIISKSTVISGLLFEPDIVNQGQLHRPIVASPPTRPEFKPAWTAEILTIVKGKKGQPAETDALMKADAADSAADIVANGQKLASETIDALTNIVGPTPRSLSLLSLAYFYNPQGDYVRSLFYGMLYWLNFGSDEEVHLRKLLFSVHRGAFEDCLIENKTAVVRRIARRSGSGAEVTLQTAKYFNSLLKILISYEGAIETESFKEANQQYIETLGQTPRGPVSTVNETTVSASRVYQGSNRAFVQIRDYLNSQQRCAICGGVTYRLTIHR